MANSMAVSSRCTLPLRRASATAIEHGRGALLELVELPQGQAPGELGGGDQLGAAVGLGDGQRLVGELARGASTSRRGDEHRRQHAAHPHLVALLLGGQRGDRPLHQRRRARGSAGWPMSKPTPDSDIIQPSAARASSIGSPVARPHCGRVAGGGDGRGPIALRARRVAAQQRQLGPIAVRRSGR